MDPIEIPRTTIEVDRRGLLLPLIKQLNRIPENPRQAIDEINYLSEFPWYDVILPEVNFSPRQIIEYMISTHTLIKYDILAKSDLLRIVIYKYRSQCSDISQQFKFSNNMSIGADICTICYLYHLRTITNEYFTVKAILDLYYMMKEKYRIQYDCMKHTDPNAITMFSITSCFPSISLPWFAYDPDTNKLFQRTSTFMQTMFPGSNLGPQLWAPIIVSIIPRLDSKFVPIALLMAINVKANQMVKDIIGPNYIDASLNAIYQRILALNCSKAFPVRFKLKLCTKLGIVYPNIEGVYKYSDYFARYRSVAMNIISELKSQDPDLQTILSEM